MRASTWVALALYAASEGHRLRWRAGTGTERLGRNAATAGLVAYAAHVAIAFGWFHGWSHSAAAEFTAQQTAALTGWRSPAGIYVNYVFSALWAGEVAWWWAAPESYRARPPWFDRAVRAAFAFMIINGAVIFVPWPQRALGIALVAWLATAAWRAGRERRTG